MYFLTGFVTNSCYVFFRFFKSSIEKNNKPSTLLEGSTTSSIITFSIFLLLRKIWDFPGLDFMWLFSNNLNNLKWLETIWTMVVVPIFQPVYFLHLLMEFTAWKVSKYGVISGPYFPAFGLNTERHFAD